MREKLASPFLDEEIFTAASGEVWQPRAGTPALRSPFHDAAVVFEAGTLSGTFEFDSPKPAASRPGPGTLDEDAAEPVFTGKVRRPAAPLLDAATARLSSQWNDATHPALSGVTLGVICARLEQYLDRRAVDELVRRANAAATGSYAVNQATIVTLLAHQFQLKTCRTPTIGDVDRQCTTNGRVAEDTLDALGFVHHTGKTLNAADRANTTAAKTLAKVPRSVLADAETGLTASNWWSYMVSPPWLGLPIKHGIHLVLLRKLRRAQRALMALPAYANLNPAELGRILGLEEEHKGARPGNTDWSMHLFGLAIDISYSRNPWVSNPKRDTAKLADITLRAARLTGMPGAADKGLSARLLHGLATTHGDTAKIYTILTGWTRALESYFKLADDPKRIEGLLPMANAMFPGGQWFQRGESLAASAVRWSKKITPDMNDFARAVARSDAKYTVGHGFLDLARDLVIALRNDACLGWGAVDFGPSASGDIMHFDCRVEGIGRAIATAGSRAYVPTDGHLCIPATGSAPVRRELEVAEEGEAPAGWELEAAEEGEELAEGELEGAMEGESPTDAEYEGAAEVAREADADAEGAEEGAGEFEDEAEADAEGEEEGENLTDGEGASEGEDSGEADNLAELEGIAGIDTIDESAGFSDADTSELETLVEADTPRDADRPLVKVPPASTLQKVSGGNWLSFTSTAIPAYKGGSSTKPRATTSAIYVPDVAWKEKVMDLMVFFHGDPDPCIKTFDPDPKNVSKKFALDTQVNLSKRKVAVAVPVIHWIVGKSANMLGNWTAANLNAFVEEVLKTIGAESGVKPKLGRLILAGHSHAYAILSPLACEFCHEAPATKTGALAKLDEVWALDSTYSQGHTHALEAWANKCPADRFIAVLWKKNAPFRHWSNYFANTSDAYCQSGFKPPNLTMCAVDTGHCTIPSRHVEQLLGLPRNAANLCKALV